MQPGAELQTLFLAAKVRTKSKPSNKNKKYRRNQTKIESEHSNRKRGTDTNESAKPTKARKESTVQTKKGV